MDTHKDEGVWGAPRYMRRLAIWFVPLMWVLLAFGTAFITPRLDDVFDLRFASISPTSEVAFLSAIASGMMALTAIVFSLTFVFLQFGSTAYSPRLVVFFTGDPVVLHALGVFSATFLYALIALFAIDKFGSGYVPLITGALALAWLVGSVFMFLALIQRVTSLQITNVLALIGNRGRAAINEMYPLPDSAEAAHIRESAERAQVIREGKLAAPTQRVAYHGGPRVIESLDMPALVALGQRYNALLLIEYAVGDMVIDGSDVVRICDTHTTTPPALVRAAVSLGIERTIEQDPKYALRLLVDIAIKALSPAVNDPTTAVQALNQIDDLLRRIGTRQLDVGYARDGVGALRVIYPTPDWQDFLSLGIDEIRLYGAGSLQVMRRLGALLQDLEDVVPPERRAAVQLHADRVRDSILRTFTDAYDRIEAEQLDRQGLGVGRMKDEG